ncbi:MAG: ABC transporter ATP-binding protein [Candidatus Coatesbacteria bacterium]|nr:ABC transporter ATP-binding protein [Candidatus Coatesbacteria bacterium]
MTEKIIEVTRLSKKYENLIAVNSISFDIKKGEMFGIVGPDGAGKSTIIKILSCLLPFDEGKGSIFGLDISSNQKKIKKRIGYLSQHFSLYGDLTVDENIEFFAEINNIKMFEERKNKLLDFTKLTEFRKRFAENLSGGMKQKLALICTLIHTPEVLLLDEPTTGVDPVSRRDFWKILQELLKTGMTIVVTTPYLDEAERCNRIALLDNGRIMALDSLEKLKFLIESRIYEVICSEIRSAFNILKSKPFVTEIQAFGDRLNVAVSPDNENASGKIRENLQENKINIIEINEISPSLENIFIHLLTTKNNEQ